MKKILKKVILAIISLILITGIGLFLFLFGNFDWTEKYDVPDDCEVEVAFTDYKSKDDVVTFYCNLYIENHSSEDKYYKVNCDFRTEYIVKMIEERELICCDGETDFDTFFVPAQTKGAFKVKCVSNGDASKLKPDRRSPGVIVEDISKELVESEKFVKQDVYLGINDSNNVYYNLDEE